MKPLEQRIVTYPAYAVIIRCLHTRGDEQAIAIRELERRRLWLSPAQKIEAGLVSHE